MRISCNEPSLVTLGKKRSLKIENSGPKLQKQDEAKRDGVINYKPTQLQFKWILRSLSVVRASNFSVFKLIDIVILWVYYTIPFGLSFFRHFLA